MQRSRARSSPGGASGPRSRLRDRDAGLGTALPFNYFPDNDPELAPRMTWRAHRNLLFGNWINMIYQGTPYDLAELKPVV